MRRSDERGGIVGGWIFKIVILLAVLGLCVFESGSIIMAKVTVDRIAIEAADEAGLEYGRTGSSSKAQAVAEHIGDRDEAVLIGDLDVDRAAGLVTLTMGKEAKTFIVGRIGFFHRFIQQTATHTGRIR
jgi:hypothetical protein